MAAAAGQRAVGRVKRLLDRDPPFGFVSPEGGGPDLYFNEALLGGGKTWAELREQVSQYEPGEAPAVFVVEEFRGKLQAKGLVVLARAQLDELDGDGDQRVSAEEMATFLAAHPELKDASLTKREREYQRREKEYWENKEANEAQSKLRDKLFQRQDAAEDELYKKRDAENAEAKRLRDDAEQLWKAGEKERAKELQAQARKHQEQARSWKQKAIELDWKHNEEMFEYVQSQEHPGQAQDGSWIDLHGLSADFAEFKTLEVLRAAVAKGLPRVEVITGAGHHSGKAGPVVKRRILALLRQPPEGLRGLSLEGENEGSVVVSFAQAVAARAAPPVSSDVEAQTAAVPASCQADVAPRPLVHASVPQEEDQASPKKARRLCICCSRRLRNAGLAR